MSYSISVYCNDGSPLGIIPPDVYGRGVGGAELSLITWAETMVQRGHQVTIYNNPRDVGDFDGVAYRNQSDFKPQDHREVYIAFRSPNPHTRRVNSEVRLFWSTDQQTVGNFATDIFPLVDRVVCISPYHVNYHKKRYGVENGKIGYFDLGVRQQDYEQDVAKVPGRCIFCSVPERGLSLLGYLWPKIKERVPHASLVITSDYTLWGATNPLNQKYRLEFMHLPDIEFLGNIERRRLAKEQLAAEAMTTPNTYEELFCISAAECQLTGAYPITSDLGALPTTNQWGTVLKGNMLDSKWHNAFVEAVANKLNETPLSYLQMQNCAKERFNWQSICAKWEHLIETGEYS